MPRYSFLGCAKIGHAAERSRQVKELALQYPERVLTNGTNAGNGVVESACPGVQLLVGFAFAGNPIFHQVYLQVRMHLRRELPTQG